MLCVPGMEVAGHSEKQVQYLVDRERGREDAGALGSGAGVIEGVCVCVCERETNTILAVVW